MQVPVHGIRAPAADEAESVAINPAAEEGHCAAGTGGARRDLSRAEPACGQGADGGAQELGNCLRGDIVPGARMEEGVEREGRRGVMETEMVDPP